MVPLGRSGPASSSSTHHFMPTFHPLLPLLASAFLYSWLELFLHFFTSRYLFISNSCFSTPSPPPQHLLHTAAPSPPLPPSYQPSHSLGWAKEDGLETSAG